VATTDVPGFILDVNPPPPKTINVVLFGPPKSGKTTAALTAPGPILVLNLEGPNALAYARKNAQGKEVHVLTVHPDEDPRPALKECVRLLLEDTYGTFVIDTIGKYRDQLARAIGGDQPSLPQWGQISKSLIDAIRTLRDLPVNTVLIAHENIRDSDDGDRIIEPLIGGKATGDIMGEADVIAYCRPVQSEEHGVQYVGQLVEARGRRAGDRSGALGTVRPLDLSEWIATYTAAFAEDTLFDPNTEE
jgi:hypothetical protein